MKKKLFLSLAICLLFTLLLPTQAFAEKISYTWTETDGENEYTYTIEFDPDDYTTEDAVWVVIHPDWHEHEYTPEDFAEVNCIAVEKLVIEEEDGPKVHYRLTLADKGLEYVFRAIEILGRRSDLIDVHQEVTAMPPTGDIAFSPAAVVLMFVSGIGLVALISKKKKFA